MYGKFFIFLLENIIFLLFIFGFEVQAGVSDYVEKLRAKSSLELYKIFSSEKCIDDKMATESNSQKIIGLNQFCDFKNSFAVLNSQSSSEDLSESVFFNWAGQQQVEINKCVKKSINSILSSNKLSAIVLEDIKNKIPLIKEIDLKINEKQFEIRRADDQKLGSAITGELPTLESPNSQEFEKSLKDLKKERASLIASIWHGSHPVINNWITKLVQDGKSPNAETLKFKMQEYLDYNQKQDEQLKTQAVRSGNNLLFNKLDTNTKKALLNNPNIWSNFTNLSGETGQINLGEFNCRLQGKYGKGDDYLDTAIMGANFAFGGGAALMMRAPQILIKGVALSEKALGITRVGSQVLLMSASVAGGIDLTREIDQECLSERPEVLHAGASSCELNDIEKIEKYEIASLAEKNCLLSLAFNSAPAISALASYKNLREYLKDLDLGNLIGKRNTETGRLFNKNRRAQEAHDTIVAYEGVAKSIEIKTIANMPEGMRVVQVRNKEGKDLFFGEYAEKLPNGKIVRSSREIHLDPLTGAIDANYPAGRDFLEQMAKTKAGKAYFGFIDVGSLGSVNKTFGKGNGRAAGDAYIAAVAKEINFVNTAGVGKGKITLARTGGDEFNLIIDETDPAKVKEILQEIQKRVRSLDGDAHKVFLEQKKYLAKQNKKKLGPQNIPAIEAFAKVQRPDISVGAVQIGHGDELIGLAESAEGQAKLMKIDTAVKFKRDPTKYDSDLKPRKRPHPRFLAEIRDPLDSTSWGAAKNRLVVEDLDKLPQMVLKPTKEVMRFSENSIVRYQDELGRESFRLDRYVEDPRTKGKIFTSYEIPSRGNTGMLDGAHPYSAKLILEHIHSRPDNFLLNVKLGSLGKLNYFIGGTHVGDKAKSIVSEIIKEKIHRVSDLKFDMGGSDFLINLSGANRNKVNSLIKEIEKQLQSDPRFSKIIQEQKSNLQAEKMRLSKLNQPEKVTAIEEKIKAMESFDFDFKFESLSSNEIPSENTVQDIIKQFDTKYLEKKSK